jgi:hypothetical protein
MRAFSRRTARASALLRPEDLWVSPGNAATAGFHLKHLAGATDRLFTYARGEALADAQRAALAAESVSGPAAVTTALLLAELRRVVDGALAQLGATPIEYLTTQRLIGRAQRPSTVLGCLLHAAEHAARHAGQFVTTVRVLNR